MRLHQTLGIIFHNVLIVLGGKVKFTAFLFAY